VVVTAIVGQADVAKVAAIFADVIDTRETAASGSTWVQDTATMMATMTTAASGCVAGQSRPAVAIGGAGSATASIEATRTSNAWLKKRHGEKTVGNTGPAVFKGLVGPVFERHVN
jgi:hypothetical protein